MKSTALPAGDDDAEPHLLVVAEAERAMASMHFQKILPQSVIRILLAGAVKVSQRTRRQQIADLRIQRTIS